MKETRIKNLTDKATFISGEDWTKIYVECNNCKTQESITYQNDANEGNVKRFIADKIKCGWKPTPNKVLCPKCSDKSKK